MTLRVGINGFGRIGRMALRLMSEESGLTCVGINDLIPSATMAHLFKYDSTHGTFKGEVEAEEGRLKVNGQDIKVFQEKEPEKLPWGELKTDIVLECTGKFTDYVSASKHLNAGAKKVIISAPAKGDIPTFVVGVNHESYNPKEHHIASNASCTTNCLAPLVKVLHEKFTVKQGFMTTIHSYTNDQCLVDAPHKDLRRARAAAVSQIPTTTGAAKAVGLVLPELKGKLDGMAIRVPTLNVSCVDLVAVCEKPITVETVNAALKDAAQNQLKGILGYCDEPLVSVDFLGDARSSIVDAMSTKVVENLVKVISWYDNELGFCCRMLDLAKHMGKELKSFKIF